eukprot:m.87852 g.87852  ORF g.87852 m.87852 type:complete len:136 (-) comp8341_c0_seq2:440-847(-)
MLQRSALDELDLNQNAFGDLGATAIITLLHTNPRLSLRPPSYRGDIVYEMLSMLRGDDNTTAEGQTPLHLAARRNLPQACSALINLGFSPKARDKTGCSPLHIGARYGAVETCCVLLLRPRLLSGLPTAAHGEDR